METITIAEAKKRLPELISRAAIGTRFLIKGRERSVAALIGAAELERLERTSRIALRLALTLGQDEAVLKKIEQRELHPAMAAFGLWRDENDLEELAEKISKYRRKLPNRPAIEL
jgi:antitoxin (DNA-binding transcriptional repressor) of toxin-antitoxin stability system